MIHRVSGTQAKDSGSPRHARTAGGRTPSNRPRRGRLPLAVSPRTRTSQCDVLWTSLESGGRRPKDASLQEQPGDKKPDSVRREHRGGARTKGWGQNRHHPSRPAINATRPLHSADWPFPATVARQFRASLRARGGTAGGTLPTLLFRSVGGVFAEIVCAEYSAAPGCCFGPGGCPAIFVRRKSRGRGWVRGWVKSRRFREASPHLSWTAVGIGWSRWSPGSSTTRTPQTGRRPETTHGRLGLRGPLGELTPDWFGLWFPRGLSWAGRESCCSRSLGSQHD